MYIYICMYICENISIYIYIYTYTYTYTHTYITVTRFRRQLNPRGNRQVLMVNYRGSTGYGQALVDSLTGTSPPRTILQNVGSEGSRGRWGTPTMAPHKRICSTMVGVPHRSLLPSLPTEY